MSTPPPPIGRREPALAGRLALDTTLRLATLAALAIAGSLLAGCGALPASGAHTLREGPLEAVRLAMEFPGERVWPRAEYVARSEAQWEQVWGQGVSTDPRNEIRPRDGRPVVDFSRHMVIGVSRGWSFHCPHLDIQAVFERPSEIEVQFMHLWPPPEELDEEERQLKERQGNNACHAGGTLLLRWYLVPHSAKPVRFVRIRARAGG